MGVGVQTKPSRMGAGGRHRWIHAEGEMASLWNNWWNDSMGEISKRWPMRWPMLEMVSAVVTLKLPRVSMARGKRKCLPPDTPQHRVQQNCAQKVGFQQETNRISLQLSPSSKFEVKGPPRGLFLNRGKSFILAPAHYTITSPPTIPIGVHLPLQINMWQRRRTCEYEI